jgi:hypothetical protein
VPAGWLVPDQPGRLRVALSLTQPAWCAALDRLGETALVAGNAAASLGWGGPLPELPGPAAGVLPRSACGLYAPNLAEFASLWAVRDTAGPEGPQHWLEVRDVPGEVAQRVLIPPGAALAAFEELVAAAQAPPAAAATGWFPANHRLATQRRQSLLARVPWLRARHADGAPDVRPLPAALVGRLFEAARALGHPLRTTLYNRAVILAAVWTPEARTGGGPETLRYYGGDTGLELHPGGVGSAWLWTGRCACCGARRWTVEAGDRQDRLALCLAADDEAREAPWRAFLQPLLAP